jgi:hypothetical protein
MLTPCGFSQVTAKPPVTARKTDKKSKLWRQALLFPAGAECEVYTDGAEVRRFPGLGKAKIVTPNFLVLVYFNDLVDSSSRYMSTAALNGLNSAARTGDPDGIEDLIEKNEVAKVAVGTKARVMDISGYLLYQDIGQIPCDDRGGRVVRLLDGPYKGSRVVIPARNLRPILPSK